MFIFENPRTSAVIFIVVLACLYFAVWGINKKFKFTNKKWLSWNFPKLGKSSTP